MQPGILDKLIKNMNFLLILPFFFIEELPEINGILMLVALGTFHLGISYVLYAKAIQKVRAFQAVLFTMLEPILTPLCEFLLHGEVPGRWALAGGAIVMVTLVFNGLTTGRK